MNWFEMECPPIWKCCPPSALRTIGWTTFYGCKGVKQKPVMPQNHQQQKPHGKEVSPNERHTRLIAQRNLCH